MNKPLDIQKLISIPGLQSRLGYSLAPDGQTAAVVWDKSGQWQIYLVPLAGRGKPTPILASPESQMSPVFSPQGGQLAFAQDYAGDENYDILVYDLTLGTARNLTPDTPDETINPAVSWSPDGRSIAFVSYTNNLDARHCIE